VIIAAAARRSLPLIGGAIYYPELADRCPTGSTRSTVYPQTASYIDRILKRANLSDLPVPQPTKFSLIINLKTAKALVLTIRRTSSTLPTR
jgi:putative tryptophan/tyrosine transport system substrate-binding protein